MMRRAVSCAFSPPPLCPRSLPCLRPHLALLPSLDTAARPLPQLLAGKLASRPWCRRPRPPRRAPTSGLPQLQSTSGTASSRPNGAPKPSHPCLWSPECHRRDAVPPPTAGACGAAASDLLPANQGHQEVRFSPLYLSPHPNPRRGRSSSPETRLPPLLCSVNSGQGPKCNRKTDFQG